jgi:predicted PurR-regulated permease PerM
LVGLLLLLGAFTFLITTAYNQAGKIKPLLSPVSTSAGKMHENPTLSKAQARFDRFAKKWTPIIPSSTTISKQLKAKSGELGGYLWSTTVAIFGILGGLASVFVVFVLTFFFTTFKTGIIYSISQFIPPKYLPRTRIIGHHVALKMGGWLRGQLTLALIITFSVAFGMTIVGFPSYSMLVGIIGGMGELVPMVGPYLAFIPAVLIVLFSDHQTWQVVGIIIYFVALAEVEAYILAPKIMQKRVELHPVTTILAILVGGSLLGIVGALLAIPLTAGARIVLLEAVFPAIQHKSVNEIIQGGPAGRRQRCLELRQQRLLGLTPTRTARTTEEDKEDCEECR